MANKQTFKSEELSNELQQLETRLIEFTREAAQLQERLETARGDVASGKASLSDLAGLQGQSGSVDAVLHELRQRIKATEIDLAEARRVEKWQGCEVKVKEIIELKDRTLLEYEAGITYLVELLEGGINDLANKKAQFKELGLQLRNEICAHYQGDNTQMNDFLTARRRELEIYPPRPATIVENPFASAIKAWLPQSGQIVRVLHF